MSTLLTLAQQAALDDLFGTIPTTTETETAVPSALSDLLQTWLGISGEQVQGYVDKLLTQKLTWENSFIEWVERSPLDSAYGFLGGAALAFFAAEKDTNPKINSYIDASYYIATCASVGYADIFAVTQTGRAIAALVMVVGPGLADRAVNRPG